MLPIIIPAHLVKELVNKDNNEDILISQYRNTIMEKIIEACSENKNNCTFTTSILNEYVIDRLQRMFEAQGYNVIKMSNILVFSWPDAVQSLFA